MDSQSKALDDWEQYCKNVFDSTPVDTLETPLEQKARMARLEANHEEWFGYYFPKYTFAKPADFHLAATKRILTSPEWWEVRMWSRELAKSTRTMMEVLYLCLVGIPTPAPEDPRKKRRYVLVISNSQDNAIRLLMPYKINLENNRRIAHDYGPQEKFGSWQAGEFTTCAGVAFRAMGAQQSPRGTRNEEARPDVIVFDDVDTDADCRNPNTIDQQWKWLEEAAISTRSISASTTIIFCGNRIALDCCIVRSQKHADFIDEVNIRNADGKSSWPEKNSETDIARVLSQKSYSAAQKEYFNNPISEGAVFKQMAWKPALPLDKYRQLVCYTDPSYTATTKADCKAMVLVGRWENEFHVIKCFIEQEFTSTMIKWYYHMMDFVGRNSCHYYMEANFMQDTILKEVQEAGRDNRRVIPVTADMRKKNDKFTRIESALEPLNTSGRLYLNENEKHSPHMQRLEEQFLALAMKSRTHDDGPDAVEGAVWKLNEKADELAADSYHFGPGLKNKHR